MNQPETYVPPKVWSWNKENGGRFAIGLCPYRGGG